MQNQYENYLAPYAARSANSSGRRFVEVGPLTRTQYQRDRDRIVHSTAFRRLEYKTQVFVNHEGDLFRTRLTHTLEVAQIGRSIARTLMVNEDLTESICLAHDLGHTPFGHAGQDALNECMKAWGGFEHNLQSLRIVDSLEQTYALFDGLNLMFETREGILKHCSLTNAKKLGDVGVRFLEKRQASLEGQIANFADAIAYNNHDIDDGLRSGLIKHEQLMGVDLYARAFTEVMKLYPTLTGRPVTHETLRRMINAMVVDLVTTTQENIRASGVETVEDVRNARPLVGFSEAMKQEERQLKQFLRQNLYHHFQVNRMTSKARRILTELFNAFIDEPRLLPTDYQAKEGQEQSTLVADYISGMTDRFAHKEHRRLFAVEEI